MLRMRMSLRSSVCSRSLVSVILLTEADYFEVNVVLNVHIDVEDNYKDVKVDEDVNVDVGVNVDQCQGYCSCQRRQRR